MLSKNVLALLKKTFKMQKYPTADRNAHGLRLLLQGIPYYLSRSGYGLPPLSIFIHVNNTCNLKCKMCDAGQHVEDSMFYKNLSGSDNDKMPLKDFKTIIDKVQHCQPFIGIPATEPMMYPHIIEAIEYVRSKNLRCSVATNGTFLEPMAEQLIKADLTKLVVSLDGPPDTHDKIRGVPGTYKKVINGILKLDELKRKAGRQAPYIYLNYVISEDNYDKITPFVSGLPLSAVTQVDFRVMFYCTEELARKHNKLYGPKYDATAACVSGGINLDNVDTEVICDQMSQVTGNSGGKCFFFFNHGRAGLRKYYHEPEVFLDSTHCVFPWYTMQVNTDGNVIPPQRCYPQIFGNLISDNFAEIWNGPKMREFRQDLQKYGRFLACTRCEGVNF